MMVVRATRDLAPNTEITHWYRSPLDKDSKEREMNLRLPWGFRCSCIICQDLQTTEKSDLTKRTKLTASLPKAFLSGNKPNVPRIEAVLSTLEKTYSHPAYEVPRLSIWSPYLTLAMICAAHAQPQKAIEFALKALESLGYVVEGGHLPHILGTPLLVKKWGLMTDGLVGCWMSLSGAYREVAPDLVKQAEGYARITYRICVGEGETFGETYGQFSERVDGLLATAR